VPWRRTKPWAPWQGPCRSRPPIRAARIPAFRAVWIEHPTLAAGALVIHALIDSESVTGAYRFTLRPGDATIIDTECTLFARVLSITWASPR